MQAYKIKKGTVEFGKNFTYNPKTQYFNKIDEPIIDFIYELVNERYSPYYANNYTLALNDRNLKTLLKLLINKRFNIEGVGTIEEKILELQEKKKLLSDKIIEGDNRDKNTSIELTEKDLKNLLSYEQEENN